MGSGPPQAKKSPRELVFWPFWQELFCFLSLRAPIARAPLDLALSSSLPFLPLASLASLPSLPSLPSWRMASRSASAPSAPPPAAARCRGQRGLPARRGYRIWSVGSTELCVPSSGWQATHSISFANSGFTLTYVANLGFTFTSLCQPWLHSHFTLPAWLHFLFHFTSFLLHPSRLRWQIATQSGGPRASGLIAVSQRQAGKETFLRKAKARAKETFLTRKAKAKASSRESDPSDDVWTDTSPLSPRTARTAVGAARRVFFWARGVMMALMPRGFGLRYTVKQPPGHSVVYSVDVLAWGGQIQMWTSIKPTAPRSQGCYFTA